MSARSDPMIPPSRCILYAEDDEDDVFFFKNAMKANSSPYLLQAVANGEQAIDYLSGKGAFAERTRFPFPAIVLLDINMPRLNGLEVLKWIRRQPHFKSLPVLMISSSGRPEDKEIARLLGADDYLIKPSDPHDLMELFKALHSRWLTQPVART